MVTAFTTYYHIFKAEYNQSWHVLWVLLKVILGILNNWGKIWGKVEVQEEFLVNIKGTLAWCLAQKSPFGEVKI